LKLFNEETREEMLPIPHCEISPLYSRLEGFTVNLNYIILEEC